jgi:transposase
MKKISTIAGKQSKNFRAQKLTIALDLGDRSSGYCVLDEAGDVLLEQKLGTTPKTMREVFGGMPRSRIALETGMHSPWVSRVLSESGHEVIVAHARKHALSGTLTIPNLGTGSRGPSAFCLTLGFQADNIERHRLSAR